MSYNSVVCSLKWVRITTDEQTLEDKESLKAVVKIGEDVRQLLRVDRCSQKTIFQTIAFRKTKEKKKTCEILK